MEVKFYIMGSNDRTNWFWVEGPLDNYPDMESWRPWEWTYQYYKIEKVWEFPF